jgi:hypothetical protein
MTVVIPKTSSPELSSSLSAISSSSRHCCIKEKKTE